MHISNLCKRCDPRLEPVNANKHPKTIKNYKPTVYKNTFPQAILRDYVASLAVTEFFLAFGCLFGVCKESYGDAESRAGITGRGDDTDEDEEEGGAGGDDEEAR